MYIVECAGKKGFPREYPLIQSPDMIYQVNIRDSVGRSLKHLLYSLCHGVWKLVLL